MSYGSIVSCQELDLTKNGIEDLSFIKKNVRLSGVEIHSEINELKII